MQGMQHERRDQEQTGEGGHRQMGENERAIAECEQRDAAARGQARNPQGDQRQPDEGGKFGEGAAHIKIMEMIGGQHIEGGA